MIRQYSNAYDIGRDCAANQIPYNPLLFFVMEEQSQYELGYIHEMDDLEFVKPYYTKLRKRGKDS